MKVTLLQDKLAKALNISSRFINNRAQLPVLSNVLLTTSKTKLLIQATNLEISSSIFIGAKIEKEGSLAVPIRAIYDLISNLPQENLTLEDDKEQLNITSANFSAVLNGINPKDFPTVPQALNKETIELSGELLIKALSQVIFCSSQDESRPVLTGVLFLFKENLLTIVATDGFRLSQKQIQVNLLKDVISKDKLIIPRNILSEIVRIQDVSQNIKICVKDMENQILFGLSDTILTSRIIEGEFPDFEKIIPKESTTKISVAKDDFLRAIKLSAVFAKDNANIVVFSIKKEDFTLFAESSKSGNQKTRLDAKIDGESLEISFNYRFIEEFLNIIEGEDITMEFSGESAPGVFRDPKDPNFLHLVMPVKIQN